MPELTQAEQEKLAQEEAQRQTIEDTKQALKAAYKRRRES